MTGTASYVLNQQDIAYFPEMNPNIEFESGATHNIIINSPNDGDYFSCVTFPQTYKKGIRINYTLEVSGVTTGNSVTIADITSLNAGYLVTFSLNPNNYSYAISTLGESSGGYVIN